jgi:hypothetical protein
MADWLKLPLGEHKKIRRSPAMQKLVKQVAAEVADIANARAGISDGYVSESSVAPNPDVTVGNDSARAHVWAKTGEAIRAEKRDAILLGIVADRGR